MSRLVSTGPRVVALWGTTNLLMLIWLYGFGDNGIDTGLYTSGVVIVYCFAFGLFLVNKTRPESAPLRRHPTSGAPALIIACGLFLVMMGTWFGDWLSIVSPVVVAVGVIYLWMWARTGNAERPVTADELAGEGPLDAAHESAAQQELAAAHGDLATATAGVPSPAPAVGPSTPPAARGAPAPAAEGGALVVEARGVPAGAADPSVPRLVAALPSTPSPGAGSPVPVTAGSAPPPIRLRGANRTPGEQQGGRSSGEHGEDGRGQGSRVSNGEARNGEARNGEARNGEARHGEARHGEARHGKAGHENDRRRRQAAAVSAAATLGAGAIAGVRVLQRLAGRRR